MYFKCPLVFVIVLFIEAWVYSNADTSVNYGLCECGVFSGKLVNETASPVLHQKPVNVACDTFGKDQCKQICIELAKDIEVRGPDMLCAILGHSEPMRPHVYSRACSGEWVYTGMCCKHSICCHDGLRISCLGHISKKEMVSDHLFEENEISK